MKQKLSFRFFAHSWISDWNHGNVHFLRGLVRELGRQGHEVRCYEQLGSWSLTNLIRNEGETAISAIDDFRRIYPELDVRFYNNDDSLPQFLEEELPGTDVVVIHEWNEPRVVNAILAHKKRLGFRALFHDTHHRAYSSAGEILRMPLHLFDGVLAFGGALTRIYADGFGLPRVWTFHEAADTSYFQPVEQEQDADVIWIGNWGDEERTRELQEFLIGPARALKSRKFVVHGVRYPEPAKEQLANAGIEYRGYLPNLRSREAYGASLLTLHVPRRQYANGLSGIPTIRVFEAMACGIPLVCAPWEDVEKLFRPGQDYLSVPDGCTIKRAIEHLLSDESARRQLACNGLQTIRQRHTCAHRAAQLVEICEELGR